MSIGFVLGYSILSLVTLGFNASLHITLQSEFSNTSQGVMATRGFYQTLGSVLLPNTGNSLACTPGLACPNPYTLADLTNNCVSSVYVVGTRQPSHFPPSRPGNLPFLLVLTDQTQRPIGNLNTVTNSTKVGNFTFMTGCVIVSDSNPIGYKPCLTFQGAMVDSLVTTNIYSSTIFKVDPFTKQPFNWAAAYPLPDCGGVMFHVSSH
jgi:hypothetical protein